MACRIEKIEPAPRPCETVPAARARAARRVSNDNSGQTRMQSHGNSRRDARQARLPSPAKQDLRNTQIARNTNRFPSTAAWNTWRRTPLMRAIAYGLSPRGECMTPKPEHVWLVYFG